MTKSQEIIGLSVISINDGRELGRVRDLIINPFRGKVEYLVIENDLWYLGAQVISFQYLMGIGEYAVTIESNEALNALRDQGDVAVLMNMKVRVKGTKVLTKKGRFVGHVEEFYVEVETGKILCCELTLADDHAIRYIPVKGIVTFGRDILVVIDDVDELLEETMEKVFEDSENIFPEKSAPETKVSPKPPVIESLIEIKAEELPVVKAEDFPVAKGSKAAPTPLPIVEEAVVNSEEQTTEAAKGGQEEQLFGDLQNQYYIGKKVSKVIKGSNGQVLAKEGDEITQSLLKKVKDAGKYLDLIMNVKE